MSSDLTFGRLVRARRRALDLTQQDLARRVGYSVVTIRKVESDERRPSRQLAERLASCLSVGPSEADSFTRLARADAADIDTSSLLGAAREAAAGPVSLPTPLTRLIGRQSEVAAVREALLEDNARLLTLVGAPGIGKSRLGIQVAALASEAFPDGVSYVPLAPISEPALVPLAIAKVLGVQEPAGRPLAEVLIDYLRDRRLLLVLDNFEHVIDAAPFIADLLTACPVPKVLATSRAPLHIRGERLFTVPPLATPGASYGLTADDAGRFPAIELFGERARAVDPDFRLTDANAADIASICANLDGLPLAIELVAARSRLLAPSGLVARLGHRLALLTDGPRDAPAHQQALRSTIDWSYALLDAGEQALFARLAVFIGGCSLQAAEEVVNAEGDLPLTVLDGLAALADKNLLGHETRADGERYFVSLKTIREYAEERLGERGEERAIRDRFVAFYLGLAEAANARLGGDEQQRWLDRLEAAQDNLQATLRWCVSQGDAAQGLRLVAALWTFWHIRSRQAEGDRWIRLVLALPGPHEERVHAQALFGAGWIAVDRGDHGQARAWFEDSLAIFRSLGDRHGVAKALHGVGMMAQADDNDADAAVLFAESLELYRAIDDDEGLAWSLDHLGNAALGLGDYARAAALFAESQGIFHRLGHAWGRAISLHHQGLAALARGELTVARAHFLEGMELFGELANSWGIATSLDHLGYVALGSHEHRQAEEYFTESLTLSRAEDDRGGLARSLVGLASVAVADRDMRRAAYLFGGADVLAAASGIRMDPVARSLKSRDAAAVQARLDEEGIAAAWEEGRRQGAASPRTVGPAESDLR